MNKHLSGRMLAQAAIASARKRNGLAPPHAFPCADCQRQATVYDHRDYNYPLYVTPVCSRCNRLRGKAVPKRWVPGEWPSYIERHFKICRAVHGRPDLSLRKLQPYSSEAA